MGDRGRELAHSSQPRRVSQFVAVALALGLGQPLLGDVLGQTIDARQSVFPDDGRPDQPHLHLSSVLADQGYMAELGSCLAGLHGNVPTALRVVLVCTAE